MEQILEFGEVRRGLLGVSISNLSAETAEAFGIESDNLQGALVQEVFPDSAADKAGIEAGDVIIAIDGEPVADASELRNTIGLKRTGESVTVELLRDGKTRRVKATLGSAKDATVAAESAPAEDIHPRLAGASFSTYDGASQAL